MNIPEKIRVLHQTYRISEVDNLHDGADICTVRSGIWKRGFC